MRLGFTCVAILLGVLLFALRAEAVDKIFRAGAVAQDITPEKWPVSVNGGMSDRKATKALNPLHARCLVLDDGEGALVFVVVDSCMVPRDLFDEAKSLASQATGIPAKRMMMSATHTHTAVTVTGVFQSEPEEEYKRFLARKIAEGVERAWKQREPAQIGWGIGSAPEQVFNRRWFTKDGVVNTDPFEGTTDKVRMNPGFDKSVTKETAGPTDPEVSLISVRSTEGRPICLLANYSLHYVGGVDALSADYFAEFASQVAIKLEATTLDPPFVGIMSNGTSGNINNINFDSDGPLKREPGEQIKLVAASVAEVAFAAYKDIEYHDWVPLQAAQAEIELGVRKPSAEQLTQARQWLADAGLGPYGKMREIYARESVLLDGYPDTVQVILQAFRIGDLAVVSSPCETFVETGLALKKDSPQKTTFCVSLANGYNGYLPTAQHHAWGGYETWRARSSYLAVDSEAKIRETLFHLLGTKPAR
jgi:neutral ceramidase